jgi:hypothetical protein
MKKVFLGLLAIVLAFTACNKDDDNDESTGGTQDLVGDITGATTLDASVTYTLSGTLFVKDGGTLTIPAGTMIEAEEGYDQYIIVEQGGQIFVNGTADAPVKMIGKEAAADESGFWGGLIINGKAPISGETAGTTALCEMNTDVVYGGTDAGDNSGSITYLVLGNTGSKSSASVEHNGLTLDAVGNGTTIENIYVYACADDAVEFFGGSVNVTNLLSIDSDDDMFDFTQGYNGTLKNAYGVWSAAHQSTESDPRGIEADGNFDGNGPAHVGQSDFTIENLTIQHLNTGTTSNVDAMNDGIKIRRGAKATITNALVESAGTIADVLDLTDSKGNATDDCSINITYSVVSYTNIVNDADGAVGTTGVTVSTIGSNTGCAVSNFDWTGYTFGDAVTTEELSGNVTDSKTLNASTVYYLTGTLFVKDGGVLTIPAGTVIKAEEGYDQYIIVEQGGQIFVNGTAEAPVKMIGRDAEQDESGFWGGLIINGKAPISGETAGTTALCEMNTDVVYGGTDASDNSGSITYLILGNTGSKSSASVEHNGLTLDAVGNGTTIENIYVYACADDAIEFFGGSVNVTGILSINSDDDMFDFTQGYTGTLKNAYGVWSADHQSTESDPRGVEADGNFDGNGPDHVGQSDFTIENLTIQHLNTGTASNVDAMNDGIKIRRGATATITNALVTSAGTIADVLDLTDSKGNATDNCSIDITYDVSSFTNVIHDTDDNSNVVLTTNVTVSTTSTNTGCDVSDFDWTGYEF